MATEILELFNQFFVAVRSNSPWIFLKTRKFENELNHCFFLMPICIWLEVSRNDPWDHFLAVLLPFMRSYIKHTSNNDCEINFLLSPHLCKILIPWVQVQTPKTYEIIIIINQPRSRKISAINYLTPRDLAVCLRREWVAEIFIIILLSVLGKKKEKLVQKIARVRFISEILFTILKVCPRSRGSNKKTK